MSLFNRIFKLGQSHAHSAIDKMEDPIKMTEQGIRDLKKDLQGAMQSLAEVKGVTMRTRKESENNERKAMLLLQKMQNGELDASEAERLATEALSKKESHANEAIKLAQEADNHQKMSDSLQANVTKLKSTISTYENDLITLRARAKTAASTKKINKQIAKVDASGTIAMLEKMKAKVEEDESLAIAYGEMATADKSVDDEINSVLSSGKSITASANLLELKQKMGISS
jgi:phage shock protein A